MIQTGQSTVSRCWFRVSFLLRFEGAASMMSGDKTASVMTSWTTKVLNSRRRRRQFLEFRSSASAARRPTPAAPRNVTAVLVMLQKFTAILRNGRILLPRRIIFEPPSCIHLLTVCFQNTSGSELRNGGLYPCFCPARYGEGERGGDSRALRIC